MARSCCAARLRVDGGELRLRLPPELDAGEAIGRDHAALAKAAGLGATSALAGQDARAPS